MTEPGAAPSPEALTAGAEPLSIQRFGLIAGIDDPEHPIPLEWQVTGATEIRVERSDPPTGRERPYQAIESTEYMLAASNQSQTLLQSFTVYVLRPPLIESFEAHRTEVRAGEWVQLSWVVSGADRVYVDGELMDAPWSGATYVQPETTHEYVLRAENGIGETIRQVLVVVSPARTVLPVSRLPINSFVTHD